MQTSSAPAATSNAVCIRLTDGLGNQLFQYALGRSLAHRLGAELLFDTSWYDKGQQPDQPRALALSEFRVRGKFRPASEFRHFWIPPTKAGKLLWRLEQAFMPPQHRRFIQQSPADFVMTGRTFDARVLRARPGTYLCGWWISPKYFTGVEAELREELVLRDPPSRLALEYLARVSAGESVAVHVRRGDYLKQRDIGCLPDAYYRRAVEAIASRVNQPRYFVFSDDPQAARELLRDCLPAFEVVMLEPGASPSADLGVMAACKHFVIANSTFSWWGAWLSRNAAKVVVAPRHWYAGAKVAIPDVYPGEWSIVED